MLLQEDAGDKGITEFYTHLLHGLGAIKYFTDIYGESVIFTIDVFLQLTRTFESQHPSVFALFVPWFYAQNLDLKRDITSKAGILPMTIHGSKGREAETVIYWKQTERPNFRTVFFPIKIPFSGSPPTKKPQSQTGPWLLKNCAPMRKTKSNRNTTASSTLPSPGLAIISISSLERRVRCFNLFENRET
jgi:ATP-dependent exoDNAse (exonuclease V) beta subunit